MLNQLRKANSDRMKEWDPTRKLTALFFGVELAGEIGEACNVIKKLERERLNIPGSRATKEDLAEELADIIIVTDLIAEMFDIDLGNAIGKKFNKTSNARGFKTLFSNIE